MPRPPRLQPALRLSADSYSRFVSTREVPQQVFDQSPAIARRQRALIARAKADLLPLPIGGDLGRSPKVLRDITQRHHDRWPRGLPNPEPSPDLPPDEVYLAPEADQLKVVKASPDAGDDDFDQERDDLAAKLEELDRTLAGRDPIKEALNVKGGGLEAPASFIYWAMSQPIAITEAVPVGDVHKRAKEIQALGDTRSLSDLVREEQARITNAVLVHLEDVWREVGPFWRYIETGTAPPKKLLDKLTADWAAEADLAARTLGLEQTLWSGYES